MLHFYSIHLYSYRPAYLIIFVKVIISFQMSWRQLFYFLPLPLCMLRKYSSDFMHFVRIMANRSIYGNWNAIADPIGTHCLPRRPFKWWSNTIFILICLEVLTNVIQLCYCWKRNCFHLRGRQCNGFSVLIDSFHETLEDTNYNSYESFMVFLKEECNFYSKHFNLFARRSWPCAICKIKSYRW